MDCPALINKFCTPKIIWYQTDVTVIIRIMLHDVKQYYLRVEIDRLYFSTTVQEKDYYLCLNLFGSVIAEKTTHLNIEREIKICLVKAHKWTGWLRLQMEKEKNFLIIPDVDRLYSTDWCKESIFDNDQESCYEYDDTLNIMPAVPSADEESEDEAMDALFL